MGLALGNAGRRRGGGEGESRRWRPPHHRQRNEASGGEEWGARPQKRNCSQLSWMTDSTEWISVVSSDGIYIHLASIRISARECHSMNYRSYYLIPKRFEVCVSKINNPAPKTRHNGSIEAHAMNWNLSRRQCASAESRRQSTIVWTRYRVIILSRWREIIILFYLRLAWWRAVGIAVRERLNSLIHPLHGAR